MILKSNKNNFTWLVAFVLFLSILSIFSEINFRIFVHDTYENIFRLNPGFSSARNLSDRGGDSGNQNILNKSLNIFNNSGKILGYIVKERQSEFDKIAIDIKFKDYRKILDDRNEAIQRGFLIDPHEVKAEINYAGMPYKAKIKLKGDLADHWLSRYRLSLRIKLEDERTIMGMNSFSIHKPSARQHPYDQAFQDLLKSSGNLSTNFKYAEITLNEESWGIMHVEENLTKEFLEKRKKKESVIFRFSDDLFWKNYGKSTKNFYGAYKLSDSRLFASIYRSSKYLSQDHYRKIYSYVINERLKDEHLHLYDIDQHIKLFLYSLVWNNFHVLSDHNSKYYFNPYTLKLEPISSDQGIIIEIEPNFLENIGTYQYPLNYIQSFTKFDSLSEKEIDLNSILKNLKYSDDMLNQFNHIFPVDQEKSIEKFKANLDLIISNQDRIKSIIKNNIGKINQENFSPPSIDQAKDLLSHIHLRHYDDGTIKLFNLLPDEVLIEKIYSNGVSYNSSGFVLPGYNEAEYITISTEFKGLLDGEINVVTKYKDISRVHLNGPTLLSKKIINPLVQKNTKRFSFIQEVEKEIFKIKKGDWEVDKPLYVNGTLIIESGVNINFTKGSFLIVKGNIKVNGEPDKMVIFDSSDSNWKGVYVMSKNKEISSIQNMVVRNFDATEEGLLKLTGGFTIYNSNLYIKNMFIESTKAEDALNVVNSNIDIDNLEIFDAVSDGLDCDFCIGEIKNSSAEKINGDAFDFSGSELSVSNININNIKDKAFSVGENSIVELKNSNLSNVGVGIASKDSSKVLATNLNIKSFKLHAAMTYQKKPIFGRDSSLIIEKSDIDGLSPYKRQFGSSMTVNGVSIKESEVFVSELYSEGIMKK